MQLNTGEILQKGLDFQQAGQLDDAEQCYLDVLGVESTNTEALKLLSILAVTRGAYEDALNYATAAVELQPKQGDYWHLLGRIQLDIGDAASALTSLRNAAANNAADTLDVQLDLSAAHGMHGDWEQALAIANLQVLQAPTDARALHAAATAAMALERNQQALEYFQRGIQADPNESAMWAGAAKLYRSMGDLGNAWLAVERALALSPDDPNAHYIARVIRTEAVPAWHFNMMNDKIRNDAFKAAIERQIKPHHKVLEIGTGAGLLAMMASRKAAHVYTCEANSAIAMTARGLVAHNNLTDKITVIDKPSNEVEVGVDMSEKADVLIAEIFSASLLSEEVIPSLEDAKKRLLKPGAIVIPATGSMVGALVQSRELEELTHVNVVDGFDFTPFNAFTPLIMNLDTPNYALDWMSEEMELFTFDFQNNDVYPAEDVQVALEVTKDGLCQGVVQWLRLMLDPETPYENPPGGEKATRTKHWTPLFYPFAIPQHLKKGQTVTLRIAHDRKGARIELVSIY
jgi:tetratricopeptide (TPR) repeat protein